MGGAVAYYLANERTNQNSHLAVANTFLSIKKVAYNICPLLVLFAPFITNGWNSKKEIQKLCKKEIIPNVTLLHGLDDKLVPPRHSKDMKKMFEDEKKNCVLHELKDTNHVSILYGYDMYYTFNFDE